MQITKPANMQVVCKVSVHTIVLTPPSKVYNNIITKIISVVNQNGTPKEARIASCKIATTKYKRAVAPNVLDKIKNEAPVL